MKKRILCELCPKHCLLAEGESGECRIRVHLDGTLRAVTYGFPCAVHVDPMEKKPMFHFFPGSRILSLATVGCNLHCKNCQNWEISQANPEETSAYPLPPESIPLLAQRYQCRSIAYTYTEPVVYYEYTYDASVKAKEAGLFNVLVTAAYIQRRPWEELCRVTDGANIDIKAFSDEFYRTVCDGTLQPVLDACVIAKRLGVHVEITNLVIPTLNDTDAMFRDLARWLATHLGKDTPLHFSRFFPQYRMRNLPPTPAETLRRAREIALAEGMEYVYIGNLSVPDSENTRCPQCHALLIERMRYTILTNRIQKGACPECGRRIEGRWEP